VFRPRAGGAQLHFTEGHAGERPAAGETVTTPCFLLLVLLLLLLSPQVAMAAGFIDPKTVEKVRQPRMTHDMTAPPPPHTHMYLLDATHVFNTRALTLALLPRLPWLLVLLTQSQLRRSVRRASRCWWW
jgi:hypothetical protein